MRVLKDFQSYRPVSGRPLVLGLGNFDGVHLGHRALLDAVAAGALRLGGEAAVLTFREHPQSILHPDRKPPRLTATEQKLFLIGQSGIETCFLLDFSEAFSMIEAEAFTRDILVGRLGVREVYLGYNAHFGHNRRGDPGLMGQLAEKYGFRFENIPPVKAGGRFVSSTGIRELVESGQLEEAEICLGRPFSVLARVVKGDGRGRLLGYPTANLEILSEMLPPEGVYAVFVTLADWEWKTASTDPAVSVFEFYHRGPLLQGVVNYGRRPTFAGDRPQGPAAEVHLLDFNGDLYGGKLEMSFRGFVRGEKRFGDAQALRKQIARDVLAARRLLEDPGKKLFTKKSP